MSRRKARRRRQKIRREYARLREDAQLAGMIETVPEGALRVERVDPRTQGCQQLPALVRQALREGWSVPDSAKPRIVDELLQPFYAQDGPRDSKLLIALARTLLLLDREQWKRDHPEQTDGSREAVLLQVKVQTVAPVCDLIELAGAELRDLDDGAGRGQ
jgi:hypothetical protein